MTSFATLTSAPMLSNLSTTSMEAERINIYALAIPISHRLPEDHSTKHFTKNQTSGLGRERRLDRSCEWFTVCSCLLKIIKLYPKESKEEFGDLAWEQLASIVDRTARGGKDGHWRLMLCITLGSRFSSPGPLCMQMYDCTPYFNLCIRAFSDSDSTGVNKSYSDTSAPLGYHYPDESLTQSISRNISTTTFLH